MSPSRGSGETGPKNIAEGVAVMIRGHGAKVLVLIVGLLCSGVGHAAMTVNNLLALCESEQPADKGMCLGFITAVKDTANLMHVIRTNKMLLCLPEGLAAEHVVGMVVEGLKAHPDGDKQLAVSFVLGRLGNAFQCK